MALSSLPISYCTNVHPGTSVAQVNAGLDRFSQPIRERVGEMAVGLWLARSVIDELLEGGNRAIDDFSDGLRRRGLACYTFNTFPYGNFHAHRVKENVYLPDWTEPSRASYTLACARTLSSILSRLDAGPEGTLSTLPLGFKPFGSEASFIDACIDRLIETAIELDLLREQTGTLVRLAIEPEPFCILETTPETIDFFQRLWRMAAQRGVEPIARTHLGVCYDVCHQAVEFEDVAAGIAAIDAAGIRINKLHISCALELDNPARNEAGRRALAQYVEGRYLHQTIASRRGAPAGMQVGRAVDLTQELIEAPPADWVSADVWRIHFHVPVDAAAFGALRTTRPALQAALGAVAALAYAPHLEVETYTWEVLPGDGDRDLVEGLSRELLATREMVEKATAR